MTMNLAVTIAVLPCAPRIGARVHVDHRRILVNDGPAFDRRAGQAEAIIERMEMPRTAFAQRAVIDRRAEPLSPARLC